MAWQGARVLHPRAAELALRHRMRVSVTSLTGEGGATEIVPELPLEAIGRITAVAQGPLVAQIRFARPGYDQEAMTRLFAEVARMGISMDMFSIFAEHCLFTVPETRHQELLERLGPRFPGLTARPGCRKVSIVGAGMHGVPGVMARFCRLLTDEGIEILQTVDSHATISALVSDRDATRALRCLHAGFIETGS